ncbi:MAG: sugar phosphate isomerase [Lentisphaeria bacterium]|nr:sugar phosphate isomerase [Lentisphaeria bacterium]
MSENSIRLAVDFMENETQFHLGFLPTEQSSPLTKDLDKRFAASCIEGVRCLQNVDNNVLEMARCIFKSAEFAKLVETGKKTLASGGKIVFSGCGATGRLSILLECMWRDCCAKNPAVASYADQVFSIMTGGDYALVRSVEFFEDYQEFGRQQVRERGMTAGDMLVAITEGGETSSVLGTVDEALKCGSKVFLLFNNPASLLAAHLERSRKAIEDPRVCVLDLHCGPMALAGSTRMQATTSEQLVAGAALESIMCSLLNVEVPDYVKNFETLLGELSFSASAIASYIEYEASVYRNKGKITYFADDYLLDIFTDTTERSPTFMLPPFRKKDDKVSPLPWAFVKNPLRSTEQVWANGMHRALRCLEWVPEDYRRMGAPENIIANPPKIRAEELLKFEVGCESVEERCSSPEDAAVLVTVCDQGSLQELNQAFNTLCGSFAQRKVLAVGGEQKGDFKVDVHCPSTPLEIMRHMAIKLVLNTASTGIRVVLGRVTSNWMSFVDVTNKKLMDRGIRLISEIGNLSYKESCLLIFETVEKLEKSYQPGSEKPSAVQVALASLKK